MKIKYQHLKFKKYLKINIFLTLKNNNKIESL